MNDNKPVLRAMLIEIYGDERDLGYKCVECKKRVHWSLAVLTCDGLKCLNCTDCRKARFLQESGK